MDELMDTIVVGDNQNEIIIEDTNAPEGVSPAVDVSGDDATLTVITDVSLTAEGAGSTAVNVSGNNATVINDGTISSGSRVVDITDGDGSLVINTGDILGTSDQRNGTLYVDGTVDDLTVINDGTIDAGDGNLGDALSVQVGAPAEDAINSNIIISNNGTLQGRGDGAEVFDNGRVSGNGSSGLRFFNGSGTDAAQLTGAITNSGIITAEVNVGFLGGVVFEDGVGFSGTFTNESGGVISGSRNGLYLGNAQHDLIINNAGSITSDSRAVNLDGDDIILNNSGQILGSGTGTTQRNGTIYLDGTADEITITNQAGGVIDAGVGNNGSGISVQVGDDNEGATTENIAIINSGIIQGRGVGEGGVTPAGVRFFAGTAGATLADSNVTNEAGGVIASENNAGILIGTGVDADGLTIINAGTVSGDNGFAIDADGAFGDITVTNTGILEGAVRLGAGDDVVTSAAGDDTLLGGLGSDTLASGAGNDVLEGGSDSDTLTSGEGEDVFAFSGDPFDGLDVSAPGRQVSGDEDFITDFDFDNDRYRFDADDFGLLGSIVNFVSLDANVAGATISDDANVIVLQNANNGDPNTPFSAAAAANQIAALTDESRAGFFVYFNTNLGVNRLVYSTDLSDADADLSIISRQTDLVGDDAIAALTSFTADNFEFEGDGILEEQDSSLLLPGNNLVQLNLDADANALQFTVDTLNITQVSELELFRTDLTGIVIGDGPVTEFSLLVPNDQLAGFSPEFTVDEFLDGEFLRAELVGLDGTRIVSTPTAINDDQVALNFGNNTIVNVEIGEFDLGIGTSALEVNALGDEVINLTGEDGLLTATFSIFRDAALDNVVGFYQTIDADGTVVDPITGETLLPGDLGYQEAALANQIDVTLSGENGQEVTATATIEAGGFLGTFLIADGDINGDIFFSFGAANGGDDHIRQLGDNSFGFEDIAGLGDADFNDVIVSFSLV